MKIQIQYEEDRKNFIIALANNGYQVYTLVEENIVYGDKYFVVFDEIRKKKTKLEKDNKVKSI